MKKISLTFSEKYHIFLLKIKFFYFFKRVIGILLDVKLIKRNIENKILTKMSKRELATKMGIKPQSLNTILQSMSKKNNCTVATINKIAVAAELDCKELLTE